MDTAKASMASSPSRMLMPLGDLIGFFDFLAFIPS